MVHNPKFENVTLNSYEQELEDALGEAFENGRFSLPSEKERQKLNDEWSEILTSTQKRRAITLRLQERDIR